MNDEYRTFPDVAAAVWQVHLVLKDVLLAYVSTHSNTFIRHPEKASHLTISPLTFLYFVSPLCLFLADRLHSPEPRTNNLDHPFIHKAVEIVCE